MTIRTGTSVDAPIVRNLAITELGRAPTESRLLEILGHYPSVLALDQGKLCAFVFGTALSPDIIEMANLLVAKPYRGKGLGTRLIQLFEEAATTDGYHTILVANSYLWPVRGEAKRSAVPLYEGLGYLPLYSTPDTTLLTKTLGPSMTTGRATGVTE
jgi:GNAT superfamily N-acetyltransferase